MKIDPDLFQSKGLAFERLGDVGRFVIDGVRVDVLIKDDELVFYPQRSAGQRDVLERLK